MVSLFGRDLTPPPPQEDGAITTPQRISFSAHSHVSLHAGSSADLIASSSSGDLVIDPGTPERIGDIVLQTGEENSPRIHTHYSYWLNAPLRIGDWEVIPNGRELQFAYMDGTTRHQILYLYYDPTLAGPRITVGQDDVTNEYVVSEEEPVSSLDRFEGLDLD